MNKQEYRSNQLKRDAVDYFEVIVDKCMSGRLLGGLKKTIVLILIIKLHLVSALGASLFSQADLVVNDVSLITENLHQGDLALVRVKVSNNGNSDAEGFSVDLYINAVSKSKINGKRGDLSYFAKKLDAGSTLDIDFVFKTYGSLNLFASVDPLGQIPDNNNNNNTSDGLKVEVGEALVDDSYEENDIFDTAKPFALSNNSWVTKSLTSKDSDYYKVTASAGQNLVIKLYDYKNDNSNLELFLLDSSGNIIKSSESVYDQEKITFSVASSGTYTVWVKPGVNPSKYILSAFIGSLPDIEIASEVLTTEKYYDKDGNVYTPPQNNTDPLPQGVQKLYSNEFTVTVGNNSRALKANEDFYIDLFRNQSWHPKFGDIGNMSPLKVKSSDFDENGEFTIVYEDPRLEPGQYQYFFLVDSEGAIEEINRSNNLHARSVIVGTDAQLKAKDDTFESSAGKENDRHPYAPNPVYHPDEMTLSEYNLLNAPYASRAQYIEKIRITSSHGRYTNLKAYDDDFYVISVLAKSVVVLDLEYRRSMGDLDLKVYPLTSLNYIKSSVTSTNKETIILRNNGSVKKDYVVHVVPRQVNSLYSLNAKEYKSTPKADLQILSIVKKPQTDKGIPIVVTYKNNGSNSISDARVDIFAKGANALPTVGELSDYFFITGVIKPGEKVVTDLVLPITSGIYYIFGIIDSPDHIAESYEDNNVYASGSVNGQNMLPDDALEKSKVGQNDSIESASTLNIGHYLNLRALDDDWFKVEVVPGQTLRSEILFSHGFGDLDLEFYTLHFVNTNPVQTLVASGSSQNDNEFAEYANTTSAVQTIYVRVFSRNEANAYNLYFDLIPNTGAASDLNISSVLTSPLSSPEGTLMRTTVVVENRGDKDITGAENIFVELLLLSNQAKASMGDYGNYFTVLTDGLKIGEKSIVSFEYRVAQGDYRVNVILDTENQITERDETNNNFRAQLITSIGGSGPDLSVSVNSVVEPTNQASPLVVNVSVTNSGQKQVNGFSIATELLEKTALRSFSVSKWPALNFTNTLASGQSANLSLELFLDEYTPTGTFDLEVSVDPYNSIKETDEENNSAVHSGVTLSGSNPVYIETFRPHLKNAQSVDTRIELYVQNPLNSDNLTKIRDNDDANGVYSALQVGLPSGTYFIRVFSYQAGSLGDYNLFINTKTRTGLEETTVTTPDADEPNNDHYSAKIYTLLKELIQHQSLDGAGAQGAIDEDWIRFVIP